MPDSQMLPSPILYALLASVASMALTAWWVNRSLRRRVERAERAAAESARNAEVASMTGQG